MRPITRRVALAGSAALAAAAAVGAAVTPPDQRSAPAGSGRRRSPRSAAELVAAVAHARTGDTISLQHDGLYVLPRSLHLTASRVLLDGNGATLRLAPGAELAGDRLLTVTGADNVVRGLHLAGRAAGERRLPDARSVELWGRHNLVEDCLVTTAAPTAIGVGGGSDHVIRRNRVTGGGGILYAWADTRCTVCEHNVVLHARGNAIGGVGNAKRAASGHIVRDNRIEECGRFGIEDFGNIVGTRIERNVIRDVRLMGISAVGGGSVVADNRLRNAGTQNGIETGASGTRVTGNIVRWEAGRPGRGSATGVIVNSAWNHSTAHRYRGIVSSGNRITGAGIGLDLYGPLSTVVSRDDRFVNCALRAVNAAPAAADEVLLERAEIVFDGPSAAGVALRDGVSVASIDTVRLEDCSVTFTGRSGGGPSADFFVRIDRDHVSITGCTFDAGGRADPRRPVVGNASAETIDAAVVTGNRFLHGARMQAGKLVAASTVRANRFG